MCHVCSDEMTSSKGSTETELTRQNSSRHDLGQTSRVVTGIGRVCTSDAQHVEKRRLCFQDGTTANGADFYRGHRHADLQVAVVTEDLLATPVNARL
jgi:hypothetical protein